jgi:N-acetylglucosaminyldiphosphoundecaprenol N-acetyl-beta-D-mannosaminyltransferase
MKVFQLEISKYTYSDFLEEITDFVLQEHSEGGKAIFTPNPEICLKTLEDIAFLEVLNQANYLTSDGIGLYLAYQIEDSNHLQGLKLLMLPIYVFNILFRKKSLYKKY